MYRMNFSNYLRRTVAYFRDAAIGKDLERYPERIQFVTDQSIIPPNVWASFAIGLKRNPKAINFVKPEFRNRIPKNASRGSINIACCSTPRL